MIRLATMADVERIADMAQAFYATTDYPALYGELTRTQALGLAIVLQEHGLILVAERDGQLIGMVAMQIDACLFNPATRTAHEIAYWIEPEHRGGRLAVRLRDATEGALRALDVNVVRWARLRTSPDVVEALYMSGGCVETERYYSKVL